MQRAEQCKGAGESRPCLVLSDSMSAPLHLAWAGPSKHRQAIAAVTVPSHVSCSCFGPRSSVSQHLEEGAGGYLESLRAFAQAMAEGRLDQLPAGGEE
jgi:hypothetical protein